MRLRLKMHLLKDIQFENYMVLKNAKLKGLGDLNIIIGPNNCGKTSILHGINLLQKITFGRFSPSFTCRHCKLMFDNNKDVLSINGELTEREGYLGKPNAKAVFSFDMDALDKVFPSMLEWRRNLLNTMPDLSPGTETHVTEQFAKGQILLKENVNRKVSAEHCSLLIDEEFEREILKTILFCPEARLENYKNVSIPEHIRSKNFSLTDQTRLIKFLKDVLDPKLIDIRQNLDLIKMIEHTRFDTSIAEQGSGVKSLICLVADILSREKSKMLLIDEPELGLNPSAKHSFLKFLLEQAVDKQIFLATHDPTFVNPVLWNNENVSVYLFSLVDNDFVKVNLTESKEDPNTFAGYLPHTTSLKKVHIYVEGSLDVYILQIFLNKYAKNRFDKWYQVVNNVGIYHLGGDFWSHLLYTIPTRPYTATVILDGDKRELAEKALQRYEAIEKGRFKLYDSLDRLRALWRRKKDKQTTISPWPIYCLKLDQIEDYLVPRPQSKQQGPLIAHQMTHVPTEIEIIFDTVLHLADME